MCLTRFRTNKDAARDDGGDWTRVRRVELLISKVSDHKQGVSSMRRTTNDMQPNGEQAEVSQNVYYLISRY